MKFIDEHGEPIVSSFLKATVWTILGLWLLFSVPIIVGTGQVGVVTTFGKVTGREMNEGINLKMPWPIQGVWVVDTRVQKDDFEVAAASQDLQEVRAKIAVNYHLERGKVSEMYRTVGPDFKEKLIDPAVQEAFKATTASFPASELITRRPEAKDRAVKALAERLDKNGIKVTDINLVNFDFSGEFNKAIELSQVAKQQVLQAQQELEKAKVDAEQRIAQARADAEAQRLKRETLTAELVQLKAIEKWDGKMPQYMSSGDSIFTIPTK